MADTNHQLKGIPAQPIDIPLRWPPGTPYFSRYNVWASEDLKTWIACSNRLEGSTIIVSNAPGNAPVRFFRVEGIRAQ